MQASRRAFWSTQVIVWGTYALLAWLLSFSGSPEPWSFARVVTKIALAATGFLSSLALWALYERLLPRRPRLEMLSAVASAASFLMGIAWLAAYRLLTDPAALGEEDFLVHGVPCGITLLAWSALHLTSAYHRQAEVEHERALRATALASQAHLALLRCQVNPHFLFNALNSIRALVEEDPPRARAMVTELSDFFRYSLLFMKCDETTFGDELDAIRNFLAIQRIRYEEKLDVTIAIAPEARRVKVPPFLVHPLVENALKHGMETSPMPLSLEIGASTEGDALRVVVSNSGRWREPTAGGTNGTGTGLANVRERLGHLFPGRHRLEIEERGGRVRALLEVRWKEAS